jgi:beta-lactamase regulating signal transducer with metallopeptidase domain
MMSLLLESALRSLLLGLAVGLGLRLFRVRNPQIEMTAWVVVLAAALAMPLLMQWQLVRLPETHALLSKTVAIVESTARAEPSPLSSSSALPGSGFQFRAALLPIAYGIVAGTLLLRLLAGLMMTARIVRRARPVRADWTRGVDVRITDAVKAPVTFGRVVLLPVAFADWPAAKRRAVMSHERSHIEHHDFNVQVLSNLHGALFWFSPLAWWLRIRLAALAETTSDETAIRELGNRIDYAEILFDIAVSARGLPAGIAMARPAMLRQRVERILSHAAPVIALAPRRRLLLALGLLPGVLLAGGTVWHARAADLALSLPAPFARSAAVPIADRHANIPDGPSFVVIAGGNISSSGRWDLSEMLRARGRAAGDAILFTHEGTIYSITDPALVKQAAELFRPQEELGEQQTKLGDQQGALGQQQGELGRQQGELGRQIGILARQKAKEAAKHMIAAGKASLARLDKEDGDSDDIDDGDQADTDQESEQARADFERQRDELHKQMEELGRQQRQLGEQQRQLGSQQSALGKEQSRLAHESSAKMQVLIDQALSSGAAVPAP